MVKEQCSERVLRAWGRHMHQCLRNGTVQRDGRWYCWQHDSVAKEKRDAERNAKWEAKWKKEHDERLEYSRRVDAMQKACGGISTDDLERLAPGELARLLAKEANGGEV